MANNSKTLVLVADDEPSTLAMVSSHLRARGYKVLEASDGDQAWELAHEHLPHLVVLDVMMPGMSGWEVCRKIREAVSLAHTGVVMLTGIGENLNEMTSPLYGADAYVDKPFEFAMLDKRIKETLSRRRSGTTMGRPDDGALETSEAFSGRDAETGTLPGVGRTSLPKPAARAKSAPPSTRPRPPKKASRDAVPAKKPAPAKGRATVANKVVAGAKKSLAKKPAAKKPAGKPAPAARGKIAKPAVKQDRVKQTASKKRPAARKVAKRPAKSAKKPGRGAKSR